MKAPTVSVAATCPSCGAPLSFEATATSSGPAADGTYSVTFQPTEESERGIHEHLATHLPEQEATS